MTVDKRIGKRLGAYILESCIGSGATGAVYRARHSEDDTEAAVKLLTNDVTNRDALVKRFEREARILERFDQAGIVRIKGFGLDDECAFIVMELRKGKTLEERLRDSGWVTAAVWTIGLVAFGTAAGLMIYAGFAVR